jgi:hypothetical protein
MRFHCLLAAAFCVLPVVARAQLAVRMHLSKPSYIAGEPVFLIVEIENQGNNPLVIATADPLSFCGGYQFQLDGVKDWDAQGCLGSAGGSCLGSDMSLAPGATHTDRILLNRRYDLRRPGTYALHVTRYVKYGPGNLELAELEREGIVETFDADLVIRLQFSQDDELPSIFAPYLRDLESKDPDRIQEAGNVIAWLAPPFLEKTIIEMLDSPGLQGYALRGLRTLATPAAHKALAGFVARPWQTLDYGADGEEALRFLGEIGNSSDVPILLKAADANAPDSSAREAAIESAGKAGGDAAVQPLLDELESDSADTRQDAVRALYLTGSRQAVPVLIDLLRSPEDRLSGTAEYGLQVLTHREAADPQAGIPPAATYPAWVQWWSSHQAKATIFKNDQCGEALPLEK